MDGVSKDEIKEVVGADSLNELLRELKAIQSDWSRIFTPIILSKRACLAACKLDKTPGSNIKHVILGLPLMLVSDSGMSMKELKNNFKFTP